MIGRTPGESTVRMAFLPSTSSTLFSRRARRKPFKREFWVNVYPGGMTGMYDTKVVADARTGPTRIACVRVVLEGHEGDGL